jgi:hypothetical protein
VVASMKVSNLVGAAAFCCAAALSVAAVRERDVSGVSIRPEVTSLAPFKVHVVALYLELPTQDAQAAIKTDQDKHIVISMLRNISREQFVQAVEASIMRNSSTDMPILRARLDLLENGFPAPKKGNVLSFTYLHGVGTLMRGPGQEMTIPGKDFTDALLSVWLGPTPIGGALERQLLAG